jgi:hypothetical protein
VNGRRERALLAIAPYVLWVSPTLAAEPAAPPPLAAPASSAPPAPEPTHHLQSPEEASRRVSAYSLPGNTWAIDVGALGIGSGDSLAKLGFAYGFGAGVEAGLNLAHASFGLFNVEGRWHFIDTRFFDLGFRVSATYGHGEWFWVLGDVARKLLSNVDVIAFPVELTASMPVARFLQFDLGIGYRYAELFGTFGDENKFFYVESQLGLRQFGVRPGTRFFFLDNTALEVHALLPAYSALPLEDREVKVPFSDTWSIEFGLRSRFMPGVFGNIRLQYGQVAKTVYGARLYPAFELEFRL